MTTPTIEPTRYLLWLDLETTGLDLLKCEPLEVYACLTPADDLDQNSILWRVYGLASHFPDSRNFEPEALTMANESGLLEDIANRRNLANVDTVQVALDRALKHLSSMTADSAVSLAGAGVSTFDLPVLRRIAPRLVQYLTYHTYDVSVMRRAYQYATGVNLLPEGEKRHRAGPDVIAALDQGRAFDALFKGVNTAAQATPPRATSCYCTPCQMRVMS